MPTWRRRRLRSLPETSSAPTFNGSLRENWPLSAAAAVGEHCHQPDRQSCCLSAHRPVIRPIRSQSYFPLQFLAQLKVVDPFASFMIFENSPVAEARRVEGRSCDRGHCLSSQSNLQLVCGYVFHVADHRATREVLTTKICSGSRPISPDRLGGKRLRSSEKSPRQTPPKIAARTHGRKVEQVVECLSGVFPKLRLGEIAPGNWARFPREIGTHSQSPNLGYVLPLWHTPTPFFPAGFFLPSFAARCAPRVSKSPRRRRERGRERRLAARAYSERSEVSIYYSHQML